MPQSNSGIYPNPAGSWIRMAGDEVLRDYTISDATGRELRKGSRLSAGEAIRLGGLARGFYLLHAAHANGSESTYKFTIK
ncbi:MAG: T9SS type A sorting domain-containing protein [Bacteroidetes bacterium]|nr:T9SS type A sorting domain-containing protein [Bacteroidota bacterium]